ncbi:DUF1349 domain-containing protein [Microbacterium sp. AGC85]
MTHQIPGVPGSFTASAGSSWDVDPASGRVTTGGLPGTDIFTDPGGVDSQVTSTTLHNAATLLTQAPDGDFQLSAKVTVDFQEKFDAGVLFLRHDEKTWAKLCFEYSHENDPMVVTVVNHGVSDDANAFVVDGRTIHLRISRKGKVLAQHASHDGKKWVFVRAFAFPSVDAPLEIGFEAQSPNGQGCAVTFEDPRLSATTISDFRDGS